MRYTLVFIFKQDMNQVLMIHKNRGPYPNHYNGVGGKIEPTDINAEIGALREIQEETGLTANDMEPLTFLVQQNLPNGDELNVFYTKINNNAQPKQMESEELVWCLARNLLDVTDKSLAGEGNIPYFINYALTLENVA